MFEGKFEFLIGVFFVLFGFLLYCTFWINVGCPSTCWLVSLRARSLIYFGVLGEIRADNILFLFFIKFKFTHLKRIPFTLANEVI